MKGTDRAGCAAAVVSVVCLAAAIAHAGGVVGTGTPASCTEVALDAALAGGGDVSFECGASPHSIAVSFTKQIDTPTVLRGGGLITISGNATVSVFQVFFSTSLDLIDITVSRGAGSFGAVQNFGALTLTASRIELSTASGTGGGIDNYGELQLTDSEVVGNHAGNGGAGIYNGSGMVSISGGEISGNDNGNASDNVAGGGILNSGGVLSVLGATIRDNSAIHGGGIYTDGALTLVDSVIENNRVVFAGVVGNGGGVLVESGTAMITGTRFAGNTATQTGYGGGLHVRPDATATITDCTFTENAATAGGAIANAGTLVVSNSTINNNSGSYPAVGNGITGAGGPSDLTLTNVTIADNTASSGAVVYSTNGSAVLEFTTIANNTTSAGALDASAAALTIKNSILANNQAVNCGSTLTASSQGFNLSSDGSCGFFQTGDSENVDSLLGPLADNGGATLTHLPAAESDAIDRGSCTLDITTDQRGMARPQGDACDIGAVERAPNDGTTTTSVTSTTVSTTTSVTSTTMSSTTSVTSTTATSTTTTTLSSGGACADPVGIVVVKAMAEKRPVTKRIARAVTASDALAVLSAAVGSVACELCVCDVDGSGTVSASDALATLLAAVGLPVVLNCPPCA
jgi:predicted outer membrane repeat protein